MKTIAISSACLLLFICGCFLLEGSLRRGNSRVLLIKDNPSYFGKGDKEAPSGTLGTLPYHKGDTIKTIGYFSGGIEMSCFLVSANHAEVYIARADVLTADDQLYQRLGSKFEVKFAEDYDAWRRALQYVKDVPTAFVEVANESLIKTKTSKDSTAISYIITRVPEKTHVEYEIVCSSHHKDFDANAEASQVAFYMATGRSYKRDD